MSQSMKNQKDPNMYAVYLAKLETHAALLRKAAQLDIETGKLQGKLHSQTEQINYFNKVLIPKRDKMINDIKTAHEAWLKLVHLNEVKRQHIITLHNEKICNLEQEEVELKKNIYDKEIEARQLQATIAEMKEFKSDQQQIKEETTKIHALKLKAGKQKTKLQNSVKNNEKIVATKKLNCERSVDELQRCKQELAKVKDDNAKVADILKNMRITEESLVNMKLQSESMTKQLKSELDFIAATSSADEFAMTSTMKTLQTEKSKLLDDKSAHQLQHEAIILSLNNELHKLKLQEYADDVVVINLSSPVRNMTQQHRIGTYNTKNIIAQPLQNDEDNPNNEFLFLTQQNDVNDVEANNLASPVHNSQPYLNAIPEEKDTGKRFLYKVHSTPRTEVSSSSQSPNISPIFHAEKPRKQKPKKTEVVISSNNKAKRLKDNTGGTSTNGERIFKKPVCQKKKSK